MKKTNVIMPILYTEFDVYFSINEI